MDCIFTVTNLSRSIENCIRLGGNVLKESKNDNGDLFFILIKDPTGAIVGILQEEPEAD